MNRTFNIIVIGSIVLVLSLLAFFGAKPIANNINLGLDLKGGFRVVLQAEEKEGQTVTEDTIEKALGILRDRVDNLGVKETVLYPQGDDRVVIEIAGVSNPEAAIEQLKNVAQLEFWDQNKTVMLTGENLKDAQAKVNQDGTAVVSLEFDSTGADLFAKATTANVGKPLYIVMDGAVISAPNVKQAITDGNAVIEGNFTAKEAQELAVLLRSGALPVSFKIIERRSIEPSLGADSLAKSMKAGIIGILAVFIFMVGYYRLPGLVADISLVLYTLLVAGSMILLHSTLTLPGIAAFILSIGMAVDANIIIYERIKEEIRWGKTLQAAIDAGFKRALVTILDSQITTILAALVLMYFGTGPIKGFAVTLTIGLVINLVTAIFFTRYLLVMFSGLSKNIKLYGV